MTTTNGTVRLSRRAFLGGAAALAAAAALPPQLARATTATLQSPRHNPLRVALSVSPFTDAVLRSLSLTDARGRCASTPRQVQQMFTHYGATEVFVRVATLRAARVGDAEYGLDHAIERARLARGLGLPLNPELGLWGVYGDILDQPAPDFRDFPTIRLPGPWPSLTLPQMESALRSYGAAAAREILATGVRVNYWDLGNEVEYGLAGVAIRGFASSNYQPPDAVDPAIGQMTVRMALTMPEPDRIAWLRAHLWPYVGRLLAATADGVRSVQPSARFSTHTSGMGIHTSTFLTAFWSAVTDAGYVPDQLGMSFYPTSGDTGDRQAITLAVADALHRRFATPVFLAEYSYPSGPMTGPYAWNTTQAGYPQTPDGQYRYLRDLTASALGGDGISGIRPWGPDYCLPTSIWQPMSLFTTDGRAQPGLAAIRDAARSHEPTARS